MATKKKTWLPKNMASKIKKNMATIGKHDFI